MNKIEELMNRLPMFRCEIDYETDILPIMKEYAEYYCDKYKQSLIDGCFNHNRIQMIEKKDIIETELPEHE